MTLAPAPCYCDMGGFTDRPCPRHGEAGSMDLMVARAEIKRLTDENTRLREAGKVAMHDAAVQANRGDRYEKALREIAAGTLRPAHLVAAEALAQERGSAS